MSSKTLWAMLLHLCINWESQHGDSRCFGNRLSVVKENIRIISFHLRCRKVEKVWVLDSQQKDE